MESKILKITASASRRRAGLAFREGVERKIPVADLTEDQVVALKADPVLNVREASEGSAVELDETGRANAVAQFVARLDDDAKAQPKPPTVADASKALGFKVKGDELKAAWDAMKDADA